jgi:hypothetical protein
VDVADDSHRAHPGDDQHAVALAAVVTQQTVLEGNRLPPGRYLLVVTLSGSANWDRQVAFFQVAQE